MIMINYPQNMHLFRNFSKFARISEDDKIPRKIRFNLDLLSKPNIYKPDKT